MGRKLGSKNKPKVPVQSVTPEQQAIAVPVPEVKVEETKPETLATDDEKNQVSVADLASIKAYVAEHFGKQSNAEIAAACKISESEVEKFAVSPDLDHLMDQPVRATSGKYKKVRRFAVDAKTGATMMTAGQATLGDRDFRKNEPGIDNWKKGFGPDVQPILQKPGFAIDQSHPPQGT